MATESVSLDFLAKQSKIHLEEMRLLRREVADMMRLLNGTYELSRRIERREAELRDDIELMVKMELGGSLANIQTAIENSLFRIEESVGEVVQRIEAVENKF